MSGALHDAHPLTSEWDKHPMATGIINIGRNPNGKIAETPQPLGQPMEDAGNMSPPRAAKVNDRDGVSQRAIDFVYISKECGYPYIIAAIVSVFMWCGFSWLGPRVIEPVATATVSSLQDMAKTGSVLAESNKMAIELQREDRTFKAQLAENLKRFGDEVRELRNLVKGNSL